MQFVVATRLAQEKIREGVVLDEVLSTARACAALLQVRREAGTAECVPTSGGERISEQGHAYGAAEVIDQLAKARGGPHRAGVPLVGLSIDLNFVWILMLMIAGLLHSGPFVNDLCRLEATAIPLLPPVEKLLSATLHLGAPVLKPPSCSAWT